MPTSSPRNDASPAARSMRHSDGRRSSSWISLRLKCSKPGRRMGVSSVFAEYLGMRCAVSSQRCESTVHEHQRITPSQGMRRRDPRAVAIELALC
eukprot:2630044-Pleurochrysis_carterae.AAC.5